LLLNRRLVSADTTTWPCGRVSRECLHGLYEVSLQEQTRLKLLGRDFQPRHLWNPLRFLEDGTGRRGDVPRSTAQTPFRSDRRLPRHRCSSCHLLLCRVYCYLIQYELATLPGRGNRSYRFNSKNVQGRVVVEAVRHICTLGIEKKAPTCRSSISSSHPTVV
jgi:hypothetical protein